MITGDFNCAREAIDIHNARNNLKSAGFTPEERQSFQTVRYYAVLCVRLPYVFWSLSAMPIATALDPPMSLCTLPARYAFAQLCYAADKAGGLSGFIGTSTHGHVLRHHAAMARTMQMLMDAGWRDTFREQHEGVHGYTYYGYRQNCRAKKKGWRLDYFLVSEAVKPLVHDSFILNDFLGSDHCPLGLVLKAEAGE